MSLIDLLHQVTRTLGQRNGGTGNQNGWASGVVEPHVNRSTTATLPLGTLVRLQNGSQVVPTTADSEVTALGIVVGYFSGARYDQVTEADCPIAGTAAVMTKGRCLALIASDVTKGDYAFADATDGYSKSSGTMAAGAYGVWLGNGLTSIQDTCWVELFGSTVQGAGGGATYGTPAIVLGTVAAAGSIDEAIRRDSTIVAFSATVPVTQAFGDSAATGSAAHAARRDHKHGMPSGNSGFDVVFTAPTNGQQVDFECPFAGTFNAWTVMGDASGTTTIDVWKDTYANFPPTVADTMVGGGGTKPNATGAASGQGTMTGWTTAAFAKGDIIRLNVDSTSGHGRVTLSLRGVRTD